MKIFKMLGLVVFVFGTFGCALDKQIEAPQKVKIVKRVTIGEPIRKNSPQDKSGWEGYYFGKLPCADCKGVETWLHLKRVDGKGAYILREKFLGVKNRYSEGGLAWESSGKVTKLMSNKNRRVALNKNKARFMDEVLGGSLKKIKAFYGANSVFLLDDASIQKGATKGATILKFSGLTNYKTPTQDGYKSVKASYLVNCKTKAYTMSRVAHYKGTFGMRGFVYPKQTNLGDAGVVKQVAGKYCS